ncbi:MAG: site-specific integrase, partial [Deltaproteobacteria bacterium]
HCEISTVNREIGFLKAFFNKAVEWGCLTKSPAAKLKPLKQAKRRIPRFFTEREADLLLHKAQRSSSYLYLIIFTALDSGLRKSELIYLSWPDVNFDNLSIIVQAKGEWHPKDYEIRAIPINTDLATELKKHKLQQQGITRWVFPTIYGTARRNNLGRDFKRLLKNCGLYGPRVGWHTLRHTFASHLVMQGTPLKTVAELLGHRSTKTTEIYSHLAPDHLRESTEKLPFGRKKPQNGYSFGDSDKKGARPDDLTP